MLDEQDLLRGDVEPRAHLLGRLRGHHVDHVTPFDDAAAQPCLLFIVAGAVRQDVVDRPREPPAGSAEAVEVPQERIGRFPGIRGRARVGQDEVQPVEVEDAGEAARHELRQLGDALRPDDRHGGDARIPAPLVEQPLIWVHPGHRVVAQHDRLARIAREGAQGADRLVRELAVLLAGGSRLTFHQAAAPSSRPAAPTTSVARAGQSASTRS